MLLVTLFNECKGSSALFLNVHLHLVSHEVNWVVSSILSFLDVLHLSSQLELFNLQLLLVLVGFWVKVLPLDAFNINAGHSVVLSLIVGDDCKVMKVWISNLIDKALLELDFAISVLLVNIDVVKQDFNSDSSTSIFLQVKLTTIDSFFDVVVQRPAAISDGRQSFVLDSDDELKEQKIRVKI